MKKKAPPCDDKTTFRAILNYDETGMVPPQQPVEDTVENDGGDIIADEVGDLVAVLIKKPTIISASNSSDTSSTVQTYLYEFKFMKQLENQDHSSPN